MCYNTKRGQIVLGATISFLGGLAILIPSAISMANRAHADSPNKQYDYGGIDFTGLLAGSLMTAVGAATFLALLSIDYNQKQEARRANNQPAAQPDNITEETALLTRNI